MKTKLILLCLGAGLILASCSKYPPSSDRLLEDLAVYTKYDETVDFTTFKTYYMSDSIVKISDKDSGLLYNSQVQSITARIAKNMNSLGYTRTTNAKTTDLYLAVSYIVNVNVSVYYPGWYWGYPGYYPPDYWGSGGYYYPYYPTYVTSYSAGTLLMDLMDVKNKVDNKIPVCWNAYIRGLVTGNHSTSQINDCVDVAFTQTKGFPGH
ncbi:MAG: DUF4136 domain-containing protein [Bacteroidales bacterium]